MRRAWTKCSWFAGRRCLSSGGDCPACGRVDWERHRRRDRGRSGSKCHRDPHRVSDRKGDGRRPVREQLRTTQAQWHRQRLAQRTILSTCSHPPMVCLSFVSNPSPGAGSGAGARTRRWPTRPPSTNQSRIRKRNFVSEPQLISERSMTDIESTALDPLERDVRVPASLRKSL